jgi:hypothetical protein
MRHDQGICAHLTYLGIAMTGALQVKLWPSMLNPGRARCPQRAANEVRQPQPREHSVGIMFGNVRLAGTASPTQDRRCCAAGVAAATPYLWNGYGLFQAALG